MSNTNYSAYRPASVRMETECGNFPILARSADNKGVFKSYGSIMKSIKTLKDLNQSVASKKSVRTLGRTDLKLLEKPDEPIKGMIIYIIYTFLKSACFLCASFLYRRNPELGSF